MCFELRRSYDYFLRISEHLITVCTYPLITLPTSDSMNWGAVQQE